jgi:hypothetical protein
MRRQALHNTPCQAGETSDEAIEASTVPQYEAGMSATAIASGYRCLCQILSAAEF